MAIQSAASRREQTSRRISRCAQDLAIEHGFDGFTLDELAERAGVSRRTLFNYFPGKEAAVLDGPAPLDAGDLATFVGGGPEGNLLADLGHLVTSIYAREETTHEDWRRIHALLDRNPRLITVAKERFEGVAGEVRRATETREGLPPRPPACPRRRRAHRGTLPRLDGVLSRRRRPRLPGRVHGQRRRSHPAPRLTPLTPRPTPDGSHPVPHA